MAIHRPIRWFFLLILWCAGPLAAANPEVQLEDSGPAANAAKYDLKYQFQPGERVRIQTVHRAAVDTTVAGTTQQAQTVTKSVKAWRIVEVADNGDITIEYSVESVNMRQKISGRAEITYDSATDAEAPPGFEIVAKSVGVPLTVVTIDASGKVLLREEKRARPGPEQSNQMVIPLPAQPVGIGFSWVVPQDLDVADGGGLKRIKCRQRFELTAVKEGVATIQLETQLITPTDDPKIRAQLAQRLSKGTIRFDVDAGRVLSQQMDWDERVIGFSGPDSSMRYLAQYTEEALPKEAKTAAKPVAKDATE